MKKKLLCFTLLLAIIVSTIATPVSAATIQELEEERAQCRRNMDVAHEMAENARYLGFPEDSTIIKEAQRIWWENHDRRKAALAEIEELSKPSYSNADLDLLSRLVYAEAGCTWIPDWVQQAVASVVINRVNSPVYPGTIREVIYQPGQYGPAWSGSIERPADARTIENCRKVLENGSTLPANVTGQAGFISGGGMYTSYYDSVLGTTIYFSYT
jgi:spore germination cell wall hydrolase CwlJ-like protein